MNLRSFINELSSYKSRFDLREDGKIRSIDSACPISWICERQTGELYPNQRYREAAYRLGIGPNHADLIAKASDNLVVPSDSYRYEVEDIRKEMLKAIGRYRGKV